MGLPPLIRVPGAHPPARSEQKCWAEGEGGRSPGADLRGDGSATVSGCRESGIAVRSTAHHLVQGHGQGLVAGRGLLASGGATAVFQPSPDDPSPAPPSPRWACPPAASRAVDLRRDLCLAGLDLLFAEVVALHGPASSANRCSLPPGALQTCGRSWSMAGPHPTVPERRQTLRGSRSPPMIARRICCPVWPHDVGEHRGPAGCSSRSAPFLHVLHAARAVLDQPASPGARRSVGGQIASPGREGAPQKAVEEKQTARSTGNRARHSCARAICFVIRGGTSKHLEGRPRSSTSYTGIPVHRGRFHRHLLQPRTT